MAKKKLDHSQRISDDKGKADHIEHEIVKWEPIQIPEEAVYCVGDEIEVPVTNLEEFNLLLWEITGRFFNDGVEIIRLRYIKSNI